MSVTSIALLHYSVPPVVGGVESVLAQHARLMAGAGHAVRADACQACGYCVEVCPEKAIKLRQRALARGCP